MKSLSKKKIILAIFSSLVIIFLVYRLFLRRPTVAVMVVKKTAIQSKVHGPGTVQSKVTVSVSAKITGIIEKLYADQGDQVKKGQLLAELDMDELNARVAAAKSAKNRVQADIGRAQADLLKAEANLSLAQSNYERDQEVFKHGYISQAAFDNTKASLKVAKSEVNASQASISAIKSQIKQAESDLHATEAAFAYARILAPMDGLITVRKAEVGDTVAPGTPIFQMIDYQIWATSWIDEIKIAQLKEGQNASIKLRSGRIFQGEVVRINKEANTVTRELEVDVKFNTIPDPLVVGEETEVDINTGRQTALAVPLSAIIEKNGVKGTLIVSSNGITNFRPVTMGLQDDKQTAITEGLQEGDMVIINPAMIKPGKRVKPKKQLTMSN